MYKVIVYNVINNFYEYEYYDFLENGYKLYLNSDIKEKDGNFISINNDIIYSSSANFFYWKDIKIKEEETSDNQYILLKMTYWKYFYSGLYCDKDKLNFLAKKEDAKKIINLYLERNKKMNFESSNIYSIITNIDVEILEMAQNLLNISEENIMLNYRIVAICHSKYSHIPNKYKNHKDYEKYYPIKNYPDKYKGKDKKGIEKYDTILEEKYKEFSKIIDNFVEIIMEEKNVSLYVARAIAWESIQQKSIEYYGNKWEFEYDINFKKSFNNICIDFKNYNLNIIIYEYIKNIILYNEIDIDSIKEILMYFLLSKKNLKELILYNHFTEFYELIKNIKKELESIDIKQKLRTQKMRKPVKYTMDDIDIMTGLEFEKFIDLLFKKIGYLTEITKQSGDQGIDIVASKNNIKIGIQTKCYTNTVGNSAIQEVTAGKEYYNCNKVIVITNNYFTKSAIELANINNVILWDRNILKEKLKELF